MFLWPKASSSDRITAVISAGACRLWLWGSVVVRRSQSKILAGILKWVNVVEDSSGNSFYYGPRVYFRPLHTSGLPLSLSVSILQQLQCFHTTLHMKPYSTASFKMFCTLSDVCKHLCSLKLTWWRFLVLLITVYPAWAWRCLLRLQCPQISSSAPSKHREGA